MIDLWGFFPAVVCMVICWYAKPLPTLDDELAAFLKGAT